MAGLRKAKKYDWKDSNMALFGSDLERQVKKESAMGEPAWQGAGQEEGLKIWRIVKFQVTDWPKEDYGHFYTGDSYIILNTYKPKPESELLAYDVHFWIGTQSSQDEYATAAYKTVELDTFLDDVPIQHREVQGHESRLFKSYFKSITCSWSIACRCCSNYIFILNLTPGFNGLSKDNCKRIQEIFKLWELDEYATAAYKTVEVDTFLDDEAIQHREVQGHESDLFLSYFPRGVIIMEGGAETGFNHVTPEEYRTRLLHFSGKRKNIVVKEVPLARSRLNSDDVFILDQGLQIYQWNGSGANKDEKWKAMEFLNTLKEERRGRANTETIEEAGTEQSHPFYEALTGEDEPDDDEPDGEDVKDLYRVSDESGQLKFTKVKEGDVSIADFMSNDDAPSEDVFIFDNGKAAYVWVGKGASASEKKNGMTYAHNHLMKSTHPLVPVTVIREGQSNADFESALAA